MPPVFPSCRLLRIFCRNRRANVAIIAAASLPILVGSLALGVDWGYLGYQKRDAQAAVDLAALSAVADIGGAKDAISVYLANNHIPATLASETEASPAGTATSDGIMTYARGHYTPSPTIPHAKRFVAGKTPYNAVRVRLRRKATFAFASVFMAPPTIATEAVAGIDGAATISIGSRLASLNGGVLNAVLGKLLGTSLDLSVMDYQALADADVDVLSFLDTVSTHLDLKAANYAEILQSHLSVGQFLNLLADTHGLSSTVRAALDQAAEAVGPDGDGIDLSALFDLGNVGTQAPGTAAALPVEASVLDILSAAGAIADGNHQIDLDVGAAVPGLAGLSVSLLVGEPPEGTAWFAVGGAGTLVRTAQTRLKVDASIGGQGLLSALHIHLPVYLELAYAEAKIDSVACLGSAPDNAEVDVTAAPGIAEAWIGAIPDDDLDRLSPGGTDMRFAHLVDIKLLGLGVDGFAHVRIADPRQQTVRFSPADIREKRVRTVSTHSLAAPLLSSLIGDLSLKVDALGISVSTPPAVQKALATSLAAATQPLDSALYSILTALGVRVGEADVRVTGVSCGRPVLVQ